MIIKPLNKRSSRHTESGQAIVEGAIGTILITAVALGAVLLLVSTFLANSYKEKLALITDDTAVYLTTVSPTQNLNQLAQTKASQLIAIIGLPMTNPSATVVITNHMLKVTISGNCKLLPNALSILPLSVDLRDIAAVPSNAPAPWPAWLQGIPLTGASLYMPMQTAASGYVTNIIGGLKCAP